MSGLTKVTANLGPAAVRALDMLAGPGRNKTDEINHALRLAAILRPLVDDDGAVTVTAPDGTQVRIVVL